VSRQVGERTSLLFVDPEDAGLYLPALRTRFEVTVVSSASQALRAMRAYQPTLVVTELVLPDGDGASICREAKSCLENPPAVLAMSAAPDRVPEALVAGCDGVLMKPFAPNLLFARIGLLLRRRSAALVVRARRPDVRCPSCGQAGAISFDAVSRGRSWYACVPCRTVWIGVSADGGGVIRSPDTALPPAAASC
jgi:DNA-binding response OmpR family regulator